MSDPDRPCLTVDEVARLGYNAGEAVWQELWTPRSGLPFLGTAARVTVRDAEGNVLHSMSK